MTHLFDPLQLRSLSLRNRIGVSPMCQYSATDGLPTDWHLVHLGSRAVGGAALVIAEATAVEARGRISPGCTGIWSEAHVAAWAPVAKFIAEHGAVPAIQLAHAGRKASTYGPGPKRGVAPVEDGGWPDDVVAPSALRFHDSTPEPRTMTLEDIATVQQAFVDAAQYALDAGFQLIEIHAAHGYLAHSFLSPLSNQRTDDYGGRFENRIRFLLETVRRIRTEVWPNELPLGVRLSTTDWVEGGWTVEDSINLAVRLKAEGVDLIDCSSGGSTIDAEIPVAPGFQVPAASEIREKADIATAAVGVITDPKQADAIIANGGADIILMAREFLRDPYWPRRAAKELGAEITPPIQYRAAW